MPMSDAVSSEGPKTMGIQQRTSALSLMHRDFSSYSFFNLFLISPIKCRSIWKQVMEIYR